MIDWVNGHLASRIKEITTLAELHDDWYHFLGRRHEPKIRIVIFSRLKVAPMFATVLSARFTGRVRFGIVPIWMPEGQLVAEELGMSTTTTTYQMITPEGNYTFGMGKGEYLSSESMALLLRMLHPEVNDIFLLSLVFTNLACWLEVFVMGGSILRRFGNLLWSIGKWNCLLILFWLPILGLYQVPFMDTVLDEALKYLRMFALTSIAGSLRMDWLALNCIGCFAGCFYLIGTFIVFIILIKSFLGYFGISFNANHSIGDANNNVSASWFGMHWDSYIAQFRATLPPTIPPILSGEAEVDAGLQLILERLALPNLWLQPTISSDYISELPVWKYNGPLIESDFGSDNECLSPTLSSDGEEVNTAVMEGMQPRMFICEKCRILQNLHLESRTEQELAQESIESESACAKLLMDSDYKCQCQCSQHDNSPERSSRRSRHSSQSSPRKARHSAAEGERCRNKSKVKNSSLLNDNCVESGAEYNAPSGMITMLECPICLESYKCDVFLCGLPCGHSFHQDCIFNWLSRDNHCCPVCRWPAYKAKPCSLHKNA